MWGNKRKCEDIILCLTPRLVNNLRLWEKMNNVFVSWLSCIGLSKRFCITVPRKNPETLRETKSGSKMREFGWNIGGRWQWNKSKRSDFLFDLSRSLRDRDSTTYYYNHCFIVIFWDTGIIDAVNENIFKL